MSAAEDEKAYHLWIGRKVSTLRRARLDCGHPKVDAVYFHIGCDRLSCSEDCAGADHDCAAYGGAKDKSGTEKRPETVQADAPVPMVQCDTTPWVSFADVAAGPSAGGDPATVDLRRRVQDGTAPIPGRDRVHDACRAEVIRQGLSEYWLDGVRYVIESACTCPSVDISTMAERPGTQVSKGYDPDCPVCPDPYARPVAAALDAEVEIHRYDCPHSNCDWARVGLNHGVLLDLAEAHELESHVRLPWWKRWHR